MRANGHVCSSGLVTRSETHGRIWVSFTRPRRHVFIERSRKQRACSVQSGSRWGSDGTDLSNNRCFFWNPLKETSRSYLDVEPAPVRPQTVVSHAGGVELKVIDLQRLQTQRRTVCRERRALTRNRSSSFILMISAAQRHAHNIYLFV